MISFQPGLEILHVCLDLLGYKLIVCLHIPGLSKIIIR